MDSSRGVMVRRIVAGRWAGELYEKGEGRGYVGLAFGGGRGDGEVAGKSSMC